MIILHLKKFELNKIIKRNDSEFVFPLFLCCFKFLIENQIRIAFIIFYQIFLKIINSPDDIQKI